MATLSFSIKNSTGLNPAQIYVGFFGSQLNATLNGKPMQPIGQSGGWYQLDEIKSIQLDPHTSGRFYFGYDGHFQLNSNGGLPSFIEPSSPAYNIRYDKFELTFNGAASGVADLTSIDFWSIPMNLRTFQNKKTQQELLGIKPGYTGQDIFNVLSKISEPVQSIKLANDLIQAFKDAGHSLAPGIVRQLKDPASAVVLDGNKQFIRIIGPNSYPSLGTPDENLPPGLPFTPYDEFYSYLQFLIKTFGPGKTPPPGLDCLGDGKIAIVKGFFSGSSAGPGSTYEAQNYDLNVMIDNEMNLRLEGSGSVVGPISVKVSKWDLLAPSAVYGGAPTFYFTDQPKTAQTPQNNIYGWIFGDLFSGLNIGAIGSAATIGGQVVGCMSSSDWFKVLPSGGNLFGKLWKGKQVANYWNQYAAGLYPRSDAYGFSYAERFSSPLISLNPATVDTLEVELLNPSLTI